MDSKQIALLLAVVTAASVLFTNTLGTTFNTDIKEFQQWKLHHKITFQSEAQNSYRHKIFSQNNAKIALHNQNPQRTYDMGVNQFSALTDQEFQQKYLGLNIERSQLKIQVANNQHSINVGDVDWTSQGAVTDVKDQGQCGSCWAFSTTGSLEGLSKIADGTLRSFSEQQLVDCSTSYGNHGCNGGLMDNAFKYVAANGISLESQYPYKGVQQACVKNSGDFKITGSVDVKTCNQLEIAVAGRPVSVAVDATNWSKYASGVFNNCGKSLNHGVLLVGVNSQSWKVKNSWASTWGESGYIRLAKGNTCGICNVASYPRK